MIYRMRWFNLLLGLITLLLMGSPTFAQTPITVDSTTFGEITGDTAQVVYTFSAQAGQELAIELTSLTTGLTVQAVVLDGANTLIQALGNQDNAVTVRAEITLDSTQTYTILVSSTNTSIGDFVLRLSTATVDDLCETIVLDTLNEVQNLCSATGRNQACVGNLEVSATPITNLNANTPFSFSQIGDIVDIATVDSFQLSPLDTSAGVWGLAFLLVQADIPDSLPGQNVSMLLFGDVEINNTAITNPDSSLDYRPMQAFYFSSGIGEQRCNAIPDTGILIQTPDIGAQITLSINEVVVQLGSTAFFSLSNQQTLDIDLIEGSALVSAENQTQLMTTGQRISVPVDENFLPSAPPNRAIPIPNGIPELTMPNIQDSGNSAPVIVATQTNIPDESVEGHPDLPSTGQCILRSFEEDANPNVRSAPSIDASINTFILPSETYPVIGRTLESDWYQIASGWVAGFVTERGGDCENLPITYTPPTATPTPTLTPIVTVTPTPLLPVAGNNSSSITIDAEVLGTQHTLSGNISSPLGVNRDDVSYTIINSETHSGMMNNLSYSITCRGDGVEYALIIFSDGGTAPCSEIPSNYLDMGFNVLSRTISIGFDSEMGDMSDDGGAFVTWTMTFSVTN